MRLVYNDASHSYWLDGRRVSGMTTVAKIGDDSFALDNWRKRQVAIGMAIRPDLAEQVAAHFDDKDKVDKLVEEAMQVAQSHVAAALGTAGHRIAERIDLDEDIIETPMSRAIKVAWASALERAGLTILPLYVERFVVWPEEGICGRLDRVVQDANEEMFILDAKFGAGVRKYPRPVAIQLAGYAYAPFMAGEMKPSGKNGSIATEEFIDMSTLAINREKAYVLHAAEVLETGAAEVLEVDIAAGHRALTKVVFPALKWRKVVPEVLMRPIASAPIAAPQPATDDDFDRANGEPCNTSMTSPATTSSSTPSKDVSSQDITASPPASSEPGHSAPSPADSPLMSTGTTDRRTQILARLTALPDAQKARIKAAWPAGVPSLKSSHEHTDAQLDAIERLFGAAATLGGTVSQPGTSTETVKTFAGQPRQFERDMATLARPKEEPCISPSSAPSRSSTLPASSVSPSPNANSPESTTNSSERSQKDLTSGMGASTNPSDSIPSTNRPSNLGDEGPDVPDEDVAALRKAFDELDTAEQLWLSLVDNQCKAAGYVVNMSAGPTKRRWSIATAMLHCARIGVPPVRDEVDDVHEQTVRALLGVVLGEEVQPAVTLGAAFAALTIDEAERLAVLARAVGHRAHVTVDEDGEVIRVWGPAVDEIAGWVA